MPDIIEIVMLLAVVALAIWFAWDTTLGAPERAERRAQRRLRRDFNRRVRARRGSR